MRRRERGERAAEEAVLRLVQDHAAELLRFARRFSHCADDAHDAYQRSLEILVRRMHVDPPAQPLSWVRTVLRNEALAVRAQRDRNVSRFDLDFERHADRHLEDPSERAVEHEQIGQTAEALRRLKPQELTALVLRAEGLSYKEICDRTGWSYTRCNRSVYEGRRALAARLGAIESGAECERWAPLLSALADGEASAAEVAELRPHLRACARCRATLRGFHAAPAQVAALVPPVLLPLAVAPGDSLTGQVELALHALAERVTLAAMRLQGAFEGLTGAKVAAVAASTAAIAGGGAAIEHATRDEGLRGGGPAAISSTAAPPGGASLLHIAGGVPLTARAGSPTQRARGREGAPRREFATPRPDAASEFAPRTAPAEFASASAPSTASAAAAPPAPVAPESPAPERPASEFGGP